RPSLSGRGCLPMSQSPRPFNVLLDGPTIAYRSGTIPSSSGTAPPKCRIAGLLGDTGTQFHTEVESLLRSRLRIVSLILLVPTVFFLIKNLLEINWQREPDWIAPYFHTFVTVTVAVLAGLVWTRPCLVLPKLRAIELILFGLMGVFFAYLQYQKFHSNALYDL